ncbi:MAG: TRAP transporter large permease subunit [Alcanivoracaceae bacterium]|nr:TRAP transporter large permease subunit [Alcanivoracaceae bacterium]
MQTTYKIGNRSVSEWLSSLPTLVILLITIFLASGEIIHSQLLQVGQNTWDDYFLLRGAGVVQQPTCEREPNVDVALKDAIAKKEAAMADDPLADIFGSEIDEGAIRQSIIGAAQICREKWSKFEEIEARVTPGVKAFRVLEVGVQRIVSTLNEYKRLLLCMLVLICATTATFARHHIALRPARTIKDHYISTAAQLTANLMLLMSATVYRHQEQQSMLQGVQVQDFYLHIFWILGFSALALTNLSQLIKPPKDLEQGGGWGKAFLTIPLYSFMCLTAGAQFISQGYYHGISVYLGMMMELSTLFLNLALYIWIGMLLKQTRMAHLVFDIFRPWNMSPELLCFVVLFVAAFPTAYTGASGIFVIAAGATIYNELIRAGARKQLALAATAMSGSMGVVLRPCLLVVIIAALNKSVTTEELFTSGVKIFLTSLVLFFLVSQFFRKEPARIAPFGEAVPQSIRRLAPLLPYVVIMASIAFFFRDILDRKVDEFSAPIILPVMLLGVLIYEKFSHQIMKVAQIVLTLLVVLSFYQLAITSFDAPTAFGLSGIDKAHVSEIFWRDVLGAALLILNFRFGQEAPSDTSEHTPTGDVDSKFEGAIRTATNETTGHIGALLMLMALSVSTGGIIERSGLMHMLPEAFASIWIATALLVAVMVVIGMIMDPYGAVILVNATIAQVAFKNGIDPLHFWMITLVAFELGYLTPPVALNHLLSRQVVGDDEVESASIPDAPFFRRYEKYILPIIVMGTTLLIVSFLPLMSEGIHSWMFEKIASGQ